MTNVGQKAFADLWLDNYGNIDMEILSILPEKPDANLEITLITKSALAGDVDEFLAAQLVFTATINDNRFQTKVQQKKNIIVHTNYPLSPYIIVPYEVSVVLGAIILAKIEVPITANHEKTELLDGMNIAGIASAIESESETVSVNEKYDILSMQNVFVISDPRSAADIGSRRIYDENDQLQHTANLDRQNSKDNSGNTNNESKKRANIENNKDDKENRNKNNNNTYDFSREFYFKNIFPVPIRMLSVSTVSCGKVFSLRAPFLEAGHNSDDMIKNNNIKLNKNNRKNDKIRNAGWSNFIKIDKESLNYSADSIADSYKNWPAIMITFHQDVAMAGKLKASGVPRSVLNAGVGATPTPPVGSALPLTSQKSQFSPSICWLEIHSNKSTHRIPLYIVDGRIRLTSMNAVRNCYFHGRTEVTLLWAG